MKNLGTRLIGGFLILLLMIAAIAFYSSIASGRSLQESIGGNSVAAARGILVSIDTAVYDWLDRLELRSLDRATAQAVDLSNRQFASLPSPGDYSDAMETQWRSAAGGGISASTQKIIGNDLSQALRNIYITHYGKKEGDRVIAEAVVTNAYGATVASTGATERFRLDGTALWRAAKASGPTVGAVESDSAGGQAVIPMAVPIFDAAGAFSGVVMAKVSVESITHNALSVYRAPAGAQVLIATADGRLVDSTKSFRFMDDISKEPFFGKLTGASGSFVQATGGRPILYSFARSQGYLGFAGMPWILVAENDVGEALAPSAALRTNIIIVTLILLALGVAVALLISRSVTRPVAEIRAAVSEIIKEAGILAEAAGAIFASTSQFAANSSQTAAAVSQTTITIEEVKQGVHLSNEKAKQLADKARRTEEIAEAGRVSVDETTKVMIGRIREQMDTISESIMRLSEQSASIGEITTTVSDLADQSNLLAVNAAIEAAKAGEQGKGFGVVAQEIKSLAEQSKRATAQVRSLLTEIQKATSGAVMATDQGSKAVEQGMKQAGEAKESIQSLAETVAEAAMGAAQIAAASEQQRIGMDQVAMAMESIKIVTVQEVQGTRDLEIEAQNLYEAGQKLKRLVELVRM